MAVCTQMGRESHRLVVTLVRQFLLDSLVVGVARLGGLCDLVDVRQQFVNCLHAVAPKFHLLRQNIAEGGSRARQPPRSKSWSALCVSACLSSHIPQAQNLAR
eukprot:Tamp_28249.p4 GENE.Tamp_28249~~Tamp_28249.p4  ORF type:complete len:103 (-),score=10.20 Tamp_28249:100-408(-)